MPQPTTERLVIEGREVELRRSARRRRTISARVENDTIVILLPAGMAVRAEREAVRELVQRIARKSASARNDEALMRRGAMLSKRYLPGSPQASSIRWVSNMTTRWGSCSTTDASIRLSDVMIEMPQYVIDAVLLHEMVHLVEAGHGPKFQDLVRQNPDHARAEAYLAGAAFASRRTGVPQDGLLDGGGTRQPLATP